MTALDQTLWEGAIRQHDRKVVLSLLGLGLAPDLAREVAQSAWTKLMEKHKKGELDELSLPGLAIRQARFLALNQLRKESTERRTLKAVPDAATAPDAEHVVIGRQTLEQVLEALEACSAQARRIFRLAYAEPTRSHAEIAQAVGLSLQRVRQILCETRKQIRAAIDGESK